MAVREMPAPIASSHDTGKTPHTRLLDRIAGWAQFSDRDADNGNADLPGVSDAIHALYQDAGALGLEAEPVDENSEAVLRAFVLARIMPMLMTR